MNERIKQKMKNDKTKKMINNNMEDYRGPQC